MPPVAARDGLTWARPWLSWPRAAIEAYLRQHRLRPVDDPSNADPRFARSRLRANVWPVLAEAVPDAESALAGAASRAAEAAQLAREVAAQDLAQTCVDGALDIGAWRALPPGRRANALRAWLDAVLPTGAPGTLVQRLLAELPGRRAARWPAGAGWLVLYRGRLRPEASATAARTALTEPAADGGLHRCGRHAVPGSDGTLQVSAARTGGLPAQALEGAVWRARTGGEQFQREPGTPPRSLKKAYQFAGVPAHERHAPLLVAADGALLFVPGLGLDARALARPGSPRRALHWHPRGAGRA
jgi:tRNA(Ile)-lysidine synthase